MAAYRQVYDLCHLQADCQEPESAPEPYAGYNRVWATFYHPIAIDETDRWHYVFGLVICLCVHKCEHVCVPAWAFSDWLAIDSSLVYGSTFSLSQFTVCCVFVSLLRCSSFEPLYHFRKCQTVYNWQL